MAASKKLLLLLAVASAPAEASAVNSIKEEVDSVDAITYSEKLVNGDDNNIKSSEIDLKIVDSVEEHNKMEESLDTKTA